MIDWLATEVPISRLALILFSFISLHVASSAAIDVYRWFRRRS